MPSTCVHRGLLLLSLIGGLGLPSWVDAAPFAENALSLSSPFTDGPLRLRSGNPVAWLREKGWLPESQSDRRRREDEAFLKRYTDDFIRAHAAVLHPSPVDLVDSLLNPDRISIALRPLIPPDQRRQDWLDQVLHPFALVDNDYVNGLPLELRRRLFTKKFLTGDRGAAIQRFVSDNLADAFGSRLNPKRSITDQGVVLEDIQDFSSGRGVDVGTPVYRLWLRHGKSRVSLFVKGHGLLRGILESRSVPGINEAFFYKAAALVNLPVIAAEYILETRDHDMDGYTLMSEIPGQTSNTFFDGVGTARTLRPDVEAYRESLLTGIARWAALNDAVNGGDRSVIRSRHDQYKSNYLIDPNRLALGDPNAVVSIDHFYIFNPDDSFSIEELQREGHGELRALLAFPEAQTPEGFESLFKIYRQAYSDEWSMIRSNADSLKRLITTSFGDASREYETFLISLGEDPEDRLEHQRTAVLSFARLTKNVPWIVSQDPMLTRHAAASLESAKRDRLEKRRHLLSIERAFRERRQEESLDTLLTSANRGAHPRVALLHYSAPPQSMTGVDVVMGQQALWLSDHGFSVKLLSGSSEPLGHGVDSVAYPELAATPFDDSARLEANEGRYSANFRQRQIAIHARLAQELADRDVIVLYNVMSKRSNLPLTAALKDLIAEHPEKHFVIYSHNVESEVHREGPLALLNLTAAPHVTHATVSRYSQRVIAELYSLDASRIALLSPTVEPYSPARLTPEALSLFEAHGLLGDALAFVYPTRIAKTKHLAKALDIFARVATLRPVAKMILVSPGIDSYDSLLAAIARFVPDESAVLSTLRKRVEHSLLFVDASPLKDFAHHRQFVMDIVSLSDLLFFPSSMETFGLPPVEAAIVGTPVASTALPSIEETLGSTGGYFSLADDSSKIAHQLLAHLEKGRQEGWKDAALHLLERYATDHVMTTQFVPVLQRTRRPYPKAELVAA